MLKVARTLLLVFLLSLSAGLTFGQIDPRAQKAAKVLDAVTATTTSNPWRIRQLVANETILMQVYTPDNAQGTVHFEATLSDNDDVEAGSANWVEFHSISVTNSILFLEDPPPFLRVRFTRTSGTLSVTFKAAGARFKELVP